MSSASLALVRTHRPSPDYPRVAALSAAIAVNLAVFLVALRPLPLAMPPPAYAAPAMQFRFLEPPPAQPPPPPIELRPLPSPVAPAAATPHAPAPSAPVTPTRDGTLAASPVAPPAIEPAPVVAAAAPIEAGLAYRAAPLSFPTAAIRQHLHGTVLLRVLVDERGRPVDVVIERSSGHAVLDRSAREQVLATWQFQPAVVRGQPVRAWARVPVSFELRKL